MRIPEVAIIEVDAPRSKLRRRWHRLWSCPALITNFRGITSATEFAKRHLITGMEYQAVDHPTNRR